VQLVHTVDQLNAALAPARAAAQTIGLVPTMGALHAGHLSLVELAQESSDVVVVSIFVNPKQFGAGEDFDKYPRTIDADITLLEGKADIVFAPSAQDVYPPELEIQTKHAGPVGNLFEGASRPGHFDGMLTVVARLFDLVRPDIAVFGQKDAQQLALVTTMAAADYPGLEVIAAETVREPSGLAMSSRNRFLNSEQFEIAEILAISLLAVCELIESGMAASAALEIGREMISGEPETKLDYLALVDPSSFLPLSDGATGPALLIVAAQVGEVRLIDNLPFQI
jgi:pantoate--beta-alanine ligase